MTRSKLTGKTVIHILLILGSIIMVVPFVWMFLTSVKTDSEAIVIPPQIFPKIWQWSSYTDALKQLPFLSFYFNTVSMVVVRVACAIVFSSMAGYAFARIKFPGRNILFFFVLIQMMIPPQIFIIPQYVMVSHLHWLNTIQALIFPGLVSAFGTFLLRQFFMGIPKELEEAAILDGCNRWGVYWRIALPLAKSGLVALGIFTALFGWKDLLWPLIVNTDLNKMPLSAGLATLQGQFNTHYPMLMAGSMLAIIPMIVIFIFFQKQFVQGIATTGSKN